MNYLIETKKLNILLGFVTQSYFNTLFNHQEFKQNIIISTIIIIIISLFIVDKIVKY